MINHLLEKNLNEKFRKREIEEVTDLINKSNSFTIVGMPSLGISVFLKYLVTRDFVRFIHVDIDELIERTPESLFKLIAYELGCEQTNAYCIHNILDKLQSLSKGDKKIVIAFNRFDKLKAYFSESFFSNLRLLNEVNKSKILLVFTANKPFINLKPNALTGENLEVFGKNFYLKPFSREDLELLTKLHYPEEEVLKNKKYENALLLSGGHYYLFQLLLKSELMTSDPLGDSNIRLLLRQLFTYLNVEEKRQIKNIINKKSIKNINSYLINTGYIKKTNNGFELFSGIFEEYIRNDSVVRLGLMEKKLYNLFLENADSLITKDKLSEELWKETIPSDSVINSLIYRLRKSGILEQEGFFLESYKKIGYKLAKY